MTTLAGGYTYANVTIDLISPSSGLTTGGDFVTIRGGGFNEYAVVYIGGNPLNDVVIVSATEITGTTPAGVAGNATVTVTQIDDSNQLVDGFEYIQALFVNSAYPNTGVIAGGEEIYVYGTGFDEFTTIEIGGSAATGVTLIDDTSLSCTTPSSSEGFADIVVTKGAESVTLTDGFQYILPLSISSIQPAADFDIGGKSIVITGYGFDPDATVTIGGVALEDAVVSDNTIITGTVPNGTVGLQDVVVTKGGDDYTVTDGFEYIGSIQLASITPATGTFAGGVNVTIDGENFLSSAVVTVGNKQLTNQVVVNTTTITGTIPQGSSGAANVIISQTSAAGLDSDVLLNGFTYTTDPNVIAGPKAIKDSYQDILFLNGGLDADPSDVETQTGFVTPLQMSNDEVIITKPLTAVIEFTRD